jgi:hypothetical protein
MIRLPARAVLATIFEQHAHLRTLIGRCEALADGLDEGRASAAALAAAVAALRCAFEEHTRSEEAVLRPLFLAAGPGGPVDVDRMVDEHARDHREVGAELGGTATVRAALRAVERHLAAEERYFATLHDAGDAGVAVELDG